MLAGVYGALHDQLSFSISPEYFTYIKFRQFEWMGLASYPRLFAAAIGFMATWWVGFGGGWLLGRIGPSNPSSESNSDFARAVTVVWAVTEVCGFIGASLGWLRSFAEPGDWKVWQEIIDTQQLRYMIMVTYLHWASYVGGALGFVVAAIYYRRLSKSSLYN